MSKITARNDCSCSICDKQLEWCTLRDSEANLICDECLELSKALKRIFLLNTLQEVKQYQENKNR